MRILYVRNLYWPADFGGNRYPWEVTRRLARRGHDVHVLTGATPIARGRDGVDGVRISYFPVVRGNPLVTHATNAIASFGPLGRAVRERADVAMVASYDVALAYFARAVRPPSAFMYHSSFYSEAVERLRERGPVGRIMYGAIRAYMDAVERRVLGAAQRIVAVSDFSLTEITVKMPRAAARTRLIHTGVDTAFYAPATGAAASRARLDIAPGDRVAVIVGRLVGVKRYERAIDAIAELRDRGIPTTLLVVGSGPERRRLESRAAQRGVRDRVRFLGFLTGERHRDALWASDVQLCSSEFENLSLALLEGLATGLPVVSVPTGGTIELLRAIDGRLLAESADATSLAEAAARVLSAPDLRAELGARARAHVVERHDWERVVDRLEGLLGELSGEGRTA
ncbi:MAG: glycosyltransferase family 4 protein [Candidatus Limnocylindria bacterium]